MSSTVPGMVRALEVDLDPPNEPEPNGNTFNVRIQPGMRDLALSCCSRTPAGSSTSRLGVSHRRKLGLRRHALDPGTGHHFCGSELYQNCTEIE